MTDRELLELAARAAGIRYDPEISKPHPVSGAWWGLWLVIDHEPNQFTRHYWNPLTDDGDAFRLSVRLHMDILPDDDSVLVFKMNHQRFQAEEPYRNDARAATRRAIVRAAASIGADGGSER